MDTGPLNTNGNLTHFMEQKLTLFCADRRPLFVFIVRDKRSDRSPHEQSSELYSQVKLVGDHVHGVDTQCVTKAVAQKCANNNRMCIRNLLLKINTRLGGVTNAVETTVACPTNAWWVSNDTTLISLLSSSFKQFADRKTLFLGVFTAKAAAGSCQPSVLAMAYNINRLATKYVMAHEYQAGAVDFFDRFADCVGTVLQGYCSVSWEFSQGKCEFRR